jgi:hypothetical protein
MKFIIEVVRVGDAGEEVLHRAKVNVISAKWAQARAQRLINEWRARGANVVRILNQERHQVFNWRVD